MTEYVGWFLEAENWTGPAGVPNRVVEHLLLTGATMLVACAVALPVGLGLGHTRRGGALVVAVSNASRAVPTFAVLILAVVAVGFGFLPNLIALALFAIPPVLANAYVGMAEVDRDVTEAARGMGMSRGQVVRRVEIPLALPLVAAGIRTATVQVIATATLAAYVGSGGLGRTIRDGFSVRDLPAVFAGALLVALLAIAAEVVLGRVERRLSPGRGTWVRPGSEQLPGGVAPGDAGEPREEAVGLGPALRDGERQG